MANFNEKINSHVAFILRDQESNYFIQKSDSMEEFERNINCLQFRKDPYRLYIQYKDAHPVESMAGHCFRWECVSATGKIANVKCLDCDSNDYFGDPVFDSIAGAIFITDKYAVTYGDTWIEAVDLKKEYVVCKAYVCGRFVSEFRIPAETFDRLFGLKENFPMQYEDVFGKIEEAKPVQMEKTKMDNFNEKVNRDIGYILNSQEFFIYRTFAMNEFARMIYDDLYLLTNNYRLFIQYKKTHRAKKIAGRCFLWDNSHGDNMEDPGNGIELRSINDASQDDCEGFGKPRFDAMESAILITDRYVYVYGDVWIEADSIRRDKKHVICTVSLCGSLVSYFRIPAEVFDRQFGLNENFPDQYKKVFGKAEDAKPVQEENNLIEEAKRNIESCMNLLDTHECQLERAMDAIKLALMDIDDQKCELGDMLAKLDDAHRKLK